MEPTIDPESQAALALDASDATNTLIDLAIGMKNRLLQEGFTEVNAEAVASTYLINMINQAFLNYRA